MIKRFLCVCQGGNVRSAALAGILKMHHGQDALACGVLSNSDDTLRVLAEWADYIVFMSQEIMPEWPPDLATEKICLVDVGPDIYGHPFHAVLQQMLTEVVDQWADRNWEIHG